jgi:hypothetical protein
LGSAGKYYDWRSRSRRFRKLQSHRELARANRAPERCESSTVGTRRRAVFCAQWPDVASFDAELQQQSSEQFQ